jgi:hypothetical protein
MSDLGAACGASEAILARGKRIDKAEHHRFPKSTMPKR